MGRPQDKDSNYAFLEAMHYLQEHEDGQLTVSDLAQKMEEFSQDQSSAYSNRYLKSKIEEHAVLHAVLGCDTTSSPFGLGKATSLKKFQEPDFRIQAKVFDDPASTAVAIQAAGEKALVTLYGGKEGESLDSLRYRKYYEKVATKANQIQPQNLPPSSAAAKYHSLRVFYQVKQWQGQDADLSLVDFGWKINGKQVLPITTDLPAAPQRC